MKRKIYSEAKSTKLIVSAKKIKVYQKTLKGYRYICTLRKGYKQAEAYFHGLGGDNLSIIDRVTGLSLI